LLLASAATRAVRQSGGYPHVHAAWWV